jgi:hypothetical protein
MLWNKSAKPSDIHKSVDADLRPHPDRRRVLQLSKTQLITAKRYLKEAFNLIADVQAMFHNSGDARTASRLRTVGEVLLTEKEHVDRLLVKRPY